MIEHLEVVSKYIDSNSFDFYIKNFTEIIPYLHLANNYNKYYFIITNETENDIIQINHHLLNNSKNPEFDRKNLFLVSSDEKYKDWCFQNNLNFISDKKIPIFGNKYEPSIISKPKWAFENHHLFMEYYKDDDFQIIHIEGLEHNWNIIPYFKNNIYTFITWPCYFNKNLYEFGLNTLYTLNKEYNKKNIVWLSPNLDGILWAYEYGYNAILCNHNSFIDYNKFKITEEKVIYDAVMNCRPELWKRPYLAEKVNNLAYIKGATYGNEELFDYSKLICNYMNEKIIPIDEVIKIYNQSYCGMIFSESEGACYSSSEYLLCGLPVISTICRGGRDTWYNNKNSIIIDADSNSVKDAVDLCIKNIQENIFNREEIRNEHIMMSDHMRNNFIECTQFIFNNHKINIDAKEYWGKKYVHKMKKNIKTQECIKLLL
jgi:glycosyltransferase involved in cell wall biosynthesis